MSADRFRDLELHLFLAAGVRVFINNNVWISAGLANGATGRCCTLAGAPTTPRVDPRTYTAFSTSKLRLPWAAVLRRRGQDCRRARGLRKGQEHQQR